MNRLIQFTLIGALLAAPVSAKEITVELQPFTIRRSLDAKVLPNEEANLLKLDPLAWTDFEITEIADHGKHVAKDDTLVRFETEEIDRKIADLERSLASKTVQLAKAEDDFSNLKETSANRLETAKREAEIAKEENTYFTTVRRKAEEESSTQSLERKKQMLENNREELRQLKQMYLADDLTEDTEEIILVRQQDAVDAAEFAVRMATLSHERNLNVNIPREAVKLAEKQRDTALAYAKLKADIPREIELKQLEIDGLRESLKRDQQTLEETKSDRKLFEIKAPADGTFLHGPVMDGQWSPAAVAKSLVPHGKVPAHKPFATFVPATSPLTLISFIDESTALSLNTGLKGIATPQGAEETEIPVTIEALSTTKNPEGKYRVDLTAEWPENHIPAPNSSLKVHLIPYHKKATVSLPVKALRFDPEGWTVDVKLANGKSERRPVKRGRVSGDQTEILSGLEVGQVVIFQD